MRKRLFSILLALCMVLCLVPTTAFAEDSTEETPECTCEKACTEETMNAECPVCGAKGALAENCGKYAEPAAEGEASQPEGEKTQKNKGQRYAGYTIRRSSSTNEWRRRKWHCRSECRCCY